MPDLCPLRFAPVFKPRIWGGRRLARWFPALPAGTIGEAWVLSDHPEGPTLVDAGPYAGEGLATLSRRLGPALLGHRAVRPVGVAAGPAPGNTGAFPLLFKLLDAQAELSVQVHPGDEYSGLPAGERGKTEVWLVLDAAPGAHAVFGLKAGVTAADLAVAVQTGRTPDLLQHVPVQVGDVLYVPAGTIHALGAGLLVAEIQQSSDVVYRLYDYDRPGRDGRPRPLHIAHALRVTHFGPPPVPAHPALAPAGQWQELARSPYFVVERGICAGDWAQATDPASCHALLLLTGEGGLAWSGGELSLPAGQAALVPAALGEYRLLGDCQVLRVTLP